MPLLRIKVDEKIVVFQGDRKVLIGDMVRVLDIAKQAGATQIAIGAQKLNPGQSASEGS